MLPTFALRVVSFYRRSCKREGHNCELTGVDLADSVCVRTRHIGIWSRLSISSDTILADWKSLTSHMNGCVIVLIDKS